MHYFVACLPNCIATLLYIKNMTECTNNPLWDTETPSRKISHNKYYEKRGTSDKTKHKPSMPQPRTWHTQIMTMSCKFSLEQQKYHQHSIAKYKVKMQNLLEFYF